MATPSLELSVEIEDLLGRVWTWSADARRAENRPQGLYFRTQRGDGFADAGCSLTRPIDRDFPDLGLLYHFRLVDRAGSIVYEGRITSYPKTTEGGRRIDITAAGWMSHAKDRKMRAIYVDRDLSHWIDPSTQRKLDLYTGNWQPTAGSITADDATGAPALAQEIQAATWGSTALPAVESWYDSGGLDIGSVYYAWKKNSNLPTGPDNWVWQVAGAQDDKATGISATGDLQAAGPGSGTLSLGAGFKYALAQLLWFSGAGGTSNLTYALYWTCLAVYGNHGLTKQGTESATDAKGFFVGDVIRHNASVFCPMLDPSGVEDTTYPAEQVAAWDAQFPYDFWLDLNTFHQFELGVWENRKLCYRQPTTLEDWDWEVRLEDPGTEFTAHGDTVGDVFNGVELTYTDVVTGKTRRLTPDDYDELADLSVLNPGYPVWTEATVPFPTTLADALQIGRAKLAEVNKPKAGGEIKVKGRIRNRAGDWVAPYWVRAEQRVVIADHPNSSPRRVIDTRWDAGSRTLTITADRKSNRIEARMDRTTAALAARGLS